MRITIDISEDIMAEIQAMTGERKKSPAVAKALDAFVKRAKARQFGRLLREGAFDYPMTNDAIESGRDR